jgi:cyclopropane fatty-acyl-phospholipid synthase-like methyltransferase
VSRAAPGGPAAPYPKLDYDAWARTVPVDDLWGQVRRTVGGKPVSERDIRMIVETIVARLDLRPADGLIDLACGNGALSSLLFPHCGEFLGSDVSEYLIAVAESRFAEPPRRRFLVLGAAAHARGEPDPGRFTRALCYGSFAYLSADDAAAVLRAVHDRFRAVERVFIGNLPDRDRAAAFYADRTPSLRELADPGSQIGIWRTREEFVTLARTTGWRVEITTMPPEFFASRYRYDALLTRDEA